MDTPTSKHADTVAKSHSEQKVATTTRDRWDKLDIVLKSVGALGTAMVVALVGIFGSSYLASSQKEETNLRLYMELMSRREEADASLRKEMFNSIITDFLKASSGEQPDKAVLNLELLAYNFHESLDLGPLFKDVYKKLDEKRERNEIYIERLNKVARDVTAKQIAMVEEAGGKREVFISFEHLKSQPGGLTVMDDSIPMELTNAQGQVTATVYNQVKIEVLSVRPEKKELEVWLIVRNSQNIDEADAVFTVDYFDFPMIDNVRFAERFRCAIVLSDFSEETAGLAFVFFPSSRASLRERSNYDDFLHNLRSGGR